MHFTTLFILKNKSLEDLSRFDIEDMFSDRFCYCCGETTPKYQRWCDWFQIGGRWCDILKAKKGIHAERGWSNDNAPIVKNEFAIVEIKDLTEPLDRKQIYSVATMSKIYMKNDDYTCGTVDQVKFNKLLDDIDNKRFNGVIALIDCHDQE